MPSVRDALLGVARIVGAKDEAESLGEDGKDCVFGDIDGVGVKLPID